MTSINGVDPIIVNNIKVQTQRPAIIETKKSKVSEDKKDQDRDREKEKRHPEATSQSLTAAVEMLNRMLELNKVTLYFQIINNHSVIKVQLIDSNNQNLISEMLPEKVFRLVTAFNTKGFTIDELI